MSKRKGVVPVPAYPADVRSFLEEYRDKYLNDLAAARVVVDRLARIEPGLRSVYKIYSRGSVQGLAELKTPRKIRLKFNEHNLEKGATEASLFEVPDIAGFTIVVSYPSAISAVAEVLDRAIECKQLQSAARGQGQEVDGIKTIHGRAINSKGYFACHYNVRVPGVGTARPIIEIQIKTLLHDAWGAKTHDLTFKPSGKIGAELLTSFDLLGSNLANLDQQSDALRASIVRSAEVRDRKRRAVQIAVLADLARDSSLRITEDESRTDVMSIFQRVASMDSETPEEISGVAAQDLLNVFDDGNSDPQKGIASSTLLCLLAARTRRAIYFEHAQDALDIRAEAATDLVERFNIKLSGILAPFAAGYVADAIDTADEVHAEIEATLRENVENQSKFNRMRLAILSNLAYFHADLIGSDEGRKRKSLDCARDCITKVKAMYPAVGFPLNGLESSDAEIIAAVTQKDEILAEEVFFSLDNEAYVGIQSAETEAQLRAVKKRLDFLHGHTPRGAKDLARLAVDYHDYCARIRLSELESTLGT